MQQLSIAAILLLQAILIQGQHVSSGDGSNDLSRQRFRFIHGRDGLPGRDGRDGPVGPQGPPGFPGFPGHKGEIGLPGEKGSTGERGLNGDMGVQGPTGAQGLPGPKGRAGYTGARGVTGPKGTKGEQGVRGFRGAPGPAVHGVVYTRWGKSTCRSGVNRVYPGRTGSSYYGHSGGGANYICMPNDPEYSSYIPGQGRSHVYGTEYEGPPLAPGRNQHNAPCAVCDVPDKSRVLMIPAKLTCPSGWTREYYGYLMSEPNNSHRTMYTCVDQIMESVPGSQNHIVGGHFYHVEAHCNGVACPPYNNYKELTCVVCSK